jgi:adenine/guanine phosphoribosyltransferase-like PRPP-binding protein
LATGGTMNAVIKLVEQRKGNIVKILFGWDVLILNGI